MKKLLIICALVMVTTSATPNKPSVKIIDKNGKCWDCDVYGSHGVRCFPCEV